MRPLSPLKIAELENLFAEKSEEWAAMRSLLDELEHRKTDRAKRLRGRVEVRLAALENQSKEVPPLTGDLFEGRPVGVRPENQPTPSRTSSSPAASPASASQKTAETSAPSIPDEQPDDRRMPQHFTGIAAPGVKGKPDAYQPALDTDLVIDLPPDSTNIQRYVHALDALISEMRREGSGSRRYELEHGKIVDTQAGQPIYAFPFSEEAEIFEEARIEIEVDGRRSRGQIVSISEGAILICSGSDLI